MMLAGCADDGRGDFWWKMTGAARWFLASVPCKRTTRYVEFPADNATFYEVLHFRWWIDDPSISIESREGHCRQRGLTICNNGWSPDLYAHRATIVDGYGAIRESKVWVVGYAAEWFRFAWKLDAPQAIEPPPDDQGDKVCAFIATVPWKSDLPRPFWVADETLQIDLAPLASNKDHAELIWRGLIGLFIVGTFFVGAAPLAEGRRGQRVFVSFFVAALVSFFLFFRLDTLVVGPYERLLGAQAYYRFFATMPQVNGHLLPLSTINMRTMLQGPPLTTGLNQEAGKFWIITFCALALWLWFCGQRLLAGLHYFFVAHRAEPFVVPALRDKTRIDAKGLAEALTPKGSSFERPPPAYQSQNQAEKARVLTEKLEADTELAEAALRRERARAALADAEREVAEAKRRAKKL